MRIRVRKVRSRSHRYGDTMRGWRGQPLVRIWLRTKSGSSGRDIHLGQVVFGRGSTIDDLALARLIRICGVRLADLGFDGLHREELLEQLREALRKRQWLPNGWASNERQNRNSGDPPFHRKEGIG